jgi:hypothetical protein
MIESQKPLCETIVHELDSQINSFFLQLNRKELMPKKRPLQP